MILILAALLSSALARPRAYDGYDEEENAWPISDTRKYLLGQYENGINLYMLNNSMLFQN